MGVGESERTESRGQGPQRPTRVAVAGTEFFLTDKGEGPAVLLVHGQPGLGRDFANVAALLDDDHRVLSPDRPGYGLNGSGPVSMGENAELLAGLLERIGAVPSTLVGHSYGGGVAILVAARHPELVSGLVLLGSVGRGESINVFDRLLAAPYVGKALSAVCLITLGRVLPLMRRASAAVPPDLAERLRASLPDSRYLALDARRGNELLRSFVFEQRALLSEIAEVEAALKLIDTPTVVITGQWDAVVPPSVAKCISEAIRGAELLTVERVGHFVPRDAPRVVVGAVRSVEKRAGCSGAD